MSKYKWIKKAIISKIFKYCDAGKNSRSGGHSFQRQASRLLKLLF